MHKHENKWPDKIQKSSGLISILKNPSTFFAFLYCEKQKSWLTFWAYKKSATFNSNLQNKFVINFKAERL